MFAFFRKPRIVAKLNTVHHPATGKDLVTSHMVSSVKLRGNTAYICIELPDGDMDFAHQIRKNAEDVVLSLPFIHDVKIVITSEAPQKGALPKIDQTKPQKNKIEDLKSLTPKEGQRPIAPDVKHIIAVGSGKGGVGKSTVSINLATSLMDTGLKVGILDADIYGPSLPILAGKHVKPEMTADKMIKPVDVAGMKTMSIGFLTDMDQAVIWRGPMLQAALLQMLRDVDWGVLDVLVIDLPPGTGDVQMTLSQKADLSGAIIVSTPQDLALVDARKAIQMFKKVNVPVMGIIENMSLYECPDCGHIAHIFGSKGASEMADKLDIDFLGAIPLHGEVRALSDAGLQFAGNEEAPESLRDAFETITQKIIQKLAKDKKDVA